MKTKLLVALATSSLLLLVGCSSFSGSSGTADTASSKGAIESSQPIAPATGSGAYKSTEKGGKTREAAGRDSAILSTIDIELTPAAIKADFTKAEAGPVNFDIRNTSGEPQEVVLLKTDLPPDKIPLKDGKVDLANSAVKEEATMITSPMPISGEETITRTLEPGKYVLMTYLPGKIESAKTQTFTINPMGI